MSESMTAMVRLAASALARTAPPRLCNAKVHSQDLCRRLENEPVPPHLQAGASVAMRQARDSEIDLGDCAHTKVKRALRLGGDPCHDLWPRAARYRLRGYVPVEQEAQNSIGRPGLLSRAKSASPLH